MGIAQKTKGTKARLMAPHLPESEAGVAGNSPAVNSPAEMKPSEHSSPLAAAAHFFLGTLAGFVLAGVLFFLLLCLWSLLAGPFVRLQSASFVIVVALILSGGLSIWICRNLSRYWRMRSGR
jgi:hypothetical protein